MFITLILSQTFTLLGAMNVDPEVTVVHPGQTAVLNCYINNDKAVTWYAQIPDKKPIVIMKVEYSTGKWRYDPSKDYITRLRYDNSTSTHRLRLENIAKADLMLYYCMENSKVVPIRGTRLVFPVVSVESSQPTKYSHVPWILWSCVAFLCPVFTHLVIHN